MVVGDQSLDDDAMTQMIVGKGRKERSYSERVQLFDLIEIKPDRQTPAYTLRKTDGIPLAGHCEPWGSCTDLRGSPSTLQEQI